MDNHYIKILKNSILITFFIVGLGFSIFGQERLSASKSDQIQIELTAAQKTWLKNHPVIRVHNEMNWAPVNFNRHGRPSGFSIDIMDLLSKKVGFEVQYISGPSWDGFIDMVKNKDLDVMLNIVNSPARQAFLNFTSPYLEFSQALFTRKDFPQIQSIKDLAGKKFAIPKGFYVEGLLKDYPEVIQLSVKDTAEAIQAVSKGQADVLLDVMPVVNYLARRMLITNLKTGGTLGFDEDKPFSLSIGIRKDWTIFKDILQKGLAAISEKELQKIQAEWFASSPEKSPSFKLFSPEEKKWIDQHPIIRIHNEKDWPPFNYFEYGTPRGLSIDYMNLLANQLGIKVKYITGPNWGEFIGLIKQKKIDVMLNIVKTPDREKFLFYTPPYIRNPNVIVSPQKNLFQSLHELKGKTVAIPKGFYQEEVLNRSYPDIKLLLVEDVISGLKAVIFGKADATLGEKAVVDYLIQQNMLTGLIVSGEIDVGNPDLTNLRIGIRNDWPLLQSILTKAMTTITPQQMSKIQQKWILSPTKETKQTVDGIDTFFKKNLMFLVGIILAVSIILFLISGLVSRSRKRDISELYSSRELRRAGLIIITLFVGIIVLVATFRLAKFKEEIRNDLKNNLQTVLNTSHESLKIWVDGKKRELGLILRDPQLNQLIQNQLKIPRKKSILKQSASLGPMRAMFRDSAVLLGATDFYVISPDMITIGSMSDQKLGQRGIVGGKRKSLLNTVFFGDYVMIPPVKVAAPDKLVKGKTKPEASVMLFAGPVKNKEGLIIAILAVVFNPLKDFSHISQNGQIGKTGETYFFDNQGVLLTESRFKADLQKKGLIAPGQDSILNIKLVTPETDGANAKGTSLTLMVKQAISGRNGSNTEGYLDYRGIKVLGAWLWDFELDMGMATEIDWEEAFNPYVVMRNTLIITLGITVLIALILTGFSLWIGQTATRSLKKSKNQLEVRVQERTEDLTRLEKRFRDLLESAPDSMIIVNEQGVITIVNAQTEKLFGYQREELIGKEIENVIPHRFRAEHPEKRNGFIHAALSSPINVKLELIGLRKDNTEFPVEVSLNPLKTDEGLLVSAAVRDITERIIVENALKESEEKTRLLLDSVGEGIFGVDLQGKTIFINPSACSLLGFTDDELLGKPIHDLIHHTHKNLTVYPVDECPMKMAYINGKMYQIEDEVLWKKDGTAIDVVYSSTPIIQGDKIVGAVITFQDVTEKRKAEEGQKASEKRFRGYFEHSQIGMMVTHPDKGWLEVNQRTCQMLGYSFEELKQLTWEELTHPDDLDKDTQNYENIISGEIDNYDIDKRFVRKDGEIVHVNLSVVCVRDESGEVQTFLASILDITDSKNTENELKRRFDELERFRRLAIGREQKMIQLKKEINGLLKTSNLPGKYKIHENT